MHRFAPRLIFACAGLCLLTACSQNRAQTKVTSPELPDIPQLEKGIPVDVAVEGERNAPRAVFVRIPPPPEPTEREKAILAAAEPPDDGTSDPLEFYVPQPMRPLAPEYFGPSVGLQSARPLSASASSFYREGVASAGGGEAGQVARLGGSSALRAAMYDRTPSISAAGPESSLRIDYIGDKRISAHDRPRYRP